MITDHQKSRAAGRGERPWVNAPLPAQLSAGRSRRERRPDAEFLSLPFATGEAEAADETFAPNALLFVRRETRGGPRAPRLRALPVVDGGERSQCLRRTAWLALRDCRDQAAGGGGAGVEGASTSTSTVSPGAMTDEPAGVPVRITSPGSRVMCCDRSATMRGKEKSRSAVVSSCTRSPFTHVRTPQRGGVDRCGRRTVLDRSA